MQKKKTDMKVSACLFFSVQGGSDTSKSQRIGFRRVRGVGRGCRRGYCDEREVSVTGRERRAC